MFNQDCYSNAIDMVEVEGVEPSCAASETAILPLDDTSIVSRSTGTRTPTVGVKTRYAANYAIDRFIQW